MKKIISKMFLVIMSLVMVFVSLPISIFAEQLNQLSNDGTTLENGFQSNEIIMAGDSFSNNSYFNLTTYTDYSSYTPEQYMAKLILNNNYIGYANDYNADNRTAFQSLYEDLYYNPTEASGARIVRDEYFNANDLKTLNTIYGILTFKPSTHTDTIMDLEDYYTAVILDVLGAKIKNQNYIDYLNSDLNKMILTLSKEVANYLACDISDFDTLDIAKLSDSELNELIDFITTNNTTSNLLKNVGDNIGLIGDVIGAAQNVNEAIKNISNYAVLSNIQDETISVIERMYELSDNNLPLKSALKKIYEYSNDSMSYSLLSIIEANEAASEIIIGDLADLWWSGSLTAMLGVYSAGVLIGQALGVTIANFCFSTDAANEQLLVIGAMADVEVVLLQAVESLGNEFKSNESEANAKNFLQSLHFLLSTYYVGHSYTKDFVEVAYTDGFITNLIHADDDTLEYWREAIPARQNSIRWDSLDKATYASFYEVDAPSGFEIYYNNQNVPIENISIKQIRELHKGESFCISDLFSIEYTPNNYTEYGDISVISSNESVVSITKDIWQEKVISGIGEGVCTLTFTSYNRRFEININIAVKSNEDLNHNYINDFTYTVNSDGKSVTIKGYNNYSTNLIIPSEIDGKSVTHIARGAFYACTNLKNISIPPTLVYVDSRAFHLCSNLKGVYISDLGAWCNINFAYGDFYSNPLYYAKKLYVNGELVTDLIIPETVPNLRAFNFYNCDHIKSVFMPESVGWMGREVFYNCDALEKVVIQGDLSVIGPWAFNNCNKLGTVYIGDVGTLYDSAFDNFYRLTFVCKPGSSTESYAKNHGIKYRYYEPELSPDNYSVRINNACIIDHIRFAKGEYATSDEIRNAPDCVNLNAKVITKGTINDVFNREMADGGIYSFWIRMIDGTTYIKTVDLSIMNQEIVTDGVTMTVKNLYGVKDYFIAKGEYSTYTDVKENSIVQITKNKIGSAHDYTYILSEPGIYTICIRYDDTTRTYKFMTVELTVIEPTFTENGLQLNIGNLEGVKVIRTAHGDYSTSGEIKRSSGARSFTSRYIKNMNNYIIQYREEGLVSVAVVYNNGYESIYKYNVTKKTPLITQDEGMVTFTNLEDLKVIRYAEGIYNTSNQIKNATGSKYIQGYTVTTDSVVILLKPGTYSFCVQYKDESYNYYTVIVNS